MFSEENLFASLHNIMKKMRSIFNKKLLPLGITHSEMRLLMMIYSEDGCSQEDLVSRMEVDRSNVGRALKKLERINYVKRKKDRKDGRAYCVFITRGGKAIRDQLIIIRDNVRKTFTGSATVIELDTLTKLLEKIDRNLSDENYSRLKNVDSRESNKEES